MLVSGYSLQIGSDSRFLTSILQAVSDRLFRGPHAHCRSTVSMAAWSRASQRGSRSWNLISYVNGCRTCIARDNWRSGPVNSLEAILTSSGWQPYFAINASLTGSHPMCPLFFR
jgi:hypothetical protein